MIQPCYEQVTGPEGAAAQAQVATFSVSRPCFRWRRRWARAATQESWVTTMRVSARSRQTVSSRSDDLVSGVLVEGAGGFVGQEHAGLLDQRSRDRDPLLLPAGQLGGEVGARSPRRTDSSAAIARSRRDAAGTRRGARAVSTFSSAVRVGMRLKLWKTNPIWLARTGRGARSRAG